MILESSRPCVHTRTHFPVLHIAALPLVTIFQYIFSMVHLMKASIENQNNTCAVTSLFLLALVRRERSVDDSPASSGILRCLRRLSGSKEMNVQIPNGRDIYIYMCSLSRDLNQVLYFDFYCTIGASLKHMSIVPILGVGKEGGCINWSTGLPG